MRQTNQAGVQLIKSFEGCRLTAYKDAIGVLTIAFGHTGPDVTPGKTITQAEADQLLAQDLAKFEKGVEALVKSNINDNQFAALVSFSYNCGLMNLQKSTLLRLTNAGDFAGASKEFLKWTKAGGKELAGLVRRRQAEQVLFLTPISSPAPSAASYLPSGPTAADINVTLQEIENQIIKK